MDTCDKKLDIESYPVNFTEIWVIKGSTFSVNKETAFLCKTDNEGILCNKARKVFWHVLFYCNNAFYGNGATLSGLEIFFLTAVFLVAE